MDPSRRWHQAGSALLLLAAGVQLAAQGRLRETLAALAAASDPARRAALEAIGFFPLATGGLLVLFGTTHWILARESEPRALRRHALRNALLCAALALAAAAWQPLPAGIALFGGAALLFALAAAPRAPD